MSPAIQPPTLQQRLAERTRPAGPVVMHQRWEQLLFLHWSWEPAAIQATLPPGLFVDTHDRRAWVAVVPLFMRDVRPRFVPAMPWVSDFLELNVRTYVYDRLGRPGLYFYSLDCDQPLAVEAARRLFLLRYEHAAMRASVDAAGWVDFSVRRAGTREQAEFRYHPGAGGVATEPSTGSLEFFFLERYRLFATDAQGEQLSSMQVCHPPYRQRPAPALAWSAAPLRQAGLDPGDRGPAHVCAVEPQQVEVFGPEAV